MRVLVDENIPRATVDALRAEGHDVLDIRGTSREGSADADLWALAQGDQRLLITTDNDFKAFRHTSHAGLLIVSLRHPNRATITRRVLEVLHQFEPGEWPSTTVSARDTAAVVWSAIT